VADILDLYDTEVAQVIMVQRELTELAEARSHNYGDFERMAREKFAELGLTVDVSWYEFEIDGVKQDGAMPEITITGRTDTAFRFDPDRQVHEAVHNVLGLPGQEGWIRTDPETLRRFREGGHGHAH
jgi:hypothetical protein